MDKGFKVFRIEKNVSPKSICDLLNITKSGFSRYETEDIDAKFEKMMNLTQLSDLQIVFTVEGNTKYFGDLKIKENTTISPNKKDNIIKTIREYLSLTQEELAEILNVAVSKISKLENDNQIIKRSLLCEMSKKLEVNIIIENGNIKVCKPQKFSSFDINTLKSTLKDFVHSICLYTNDRVSLINGYNFNTKRNLPIVFYAKSIEEFIIKYVRIYDELSGHIVEDFNENNDLNFKSTYDIESYYLNNVDEFISKDFVDFTSYLWQGEGLYTIWGDGGYYTNKLEYVINEVKEDEEIYKENYIGKEYEDELLEYLLKNIK